MFIEAFRGDSVIIFGALRSAQVVSLGVLVLVMVGMHLFYHSPVREMRISAAAQVKRSLALSKA
jgi:hypothetical protein